VSCFIINSYFFSTNTINFFTSSVFYFINIIIIKLFVCIDETSLNSFMIRRKCYEELGKRCVVKTESQEVFKKYTGIFAISSKGVIGYEVYKKGGIDSNRMVDFINKFINGKYKDKLIILDNASSHRIQLVKNVIKKDNNLLYAVPYQHY